MVKLAEVPPLFVYDVVEKDLPFTVNRETLTNMTSELIGTVRVPLAPEASMVAEKDGWPVIQTVQLTGAAPTVPEVVVPPPPPPLQPPNNKKRNEKNSEIIDCFVFMYSPIFPFFI